MAPSLTVRSGPSPAVRRAVVALVVAANAVVLLRYLWGLWPFAALDDDFTYIWVAARLAWAGHAAQAYDVAGFTRTLRALLPYMPAGEYSLAYPPPYLLLAAPLGALPLTGAFFAWLAGSLAVFAAALWAVWPRRLVLVAAVLAPGFALNLWFGQNGLLFGGLIGLALAWNGRRPRSAGVALGLLALKPHLALALGLVLLVGRRWTVLAVAAATAVAAIGLSAALFGPDIWRVFLAGFGRAADLSSPVLQGVSVRGSVYWTLRTVGAAPAVALAAQAVTALVAALLAGRSWRRGDPPAVAVAVSAAALALILPRLGTYDLAFFAIAAAALAGAAAGRRATLGLALGFWLAPQVVQAGAVHDLQILPVVAVLLLIGALRLAPPAARPAPAPPG
jgi:hypothetical protein